jgi:hypothetical protein
MILGRGGGGPKNETDYNFKYKIYETWLIWYLVPTRIQESIFPPLKVDGNEK